MTSAAPGFRVVIGLEAHVQLKTRSKMFCACPADYANAEPNTRVCPVCLGMPGVLPVINRRAVDLTILTGLVLDCRIPEHAKFDRKNYAYPDLMKWYQISQYDLPLCVNGHLDVTIDGSADRVRIRRVHLEEDTAKLTHVTASDGAPASLIDVNRSGAPLMEVVTEPDIKTPAQAAAFGEQLRGLLRWIGVSTANMDEGALRIDANVSVWPADHPVGAAKVEIKNMNSFRALSRALAYEIERQTELRRRGGALVQETRGWDEASGTTLVQRTKEEAHDYRYFPEPDLPPLHVTRARVDQLRAQLPRMPDDVAADLTSQGAPSADVAELLHDRALTDYAQAVIQAGADVPAAVTWIVHDLRRVLNARGLAADAIPIPPPELAALLQLRANGSVSSTMAADVLDEMFATGKPAAAIVHARGPQISAADQLLAIARQVIQENPQAVSDYHAGKQRALQYLMGQVMRLTRGKANPGAVSALIEQELGGTG